MEKDHIAEHEIWRWNSVAEAVMGRRERDTCTPMFIAALFIIARTWKQPRCPSADEWIRKPWYIYTMESLQPHVSMVILHARILDWVGMPSSRQTPGTRCL